MTRKMGMNLMLTLVLSTVSAVTLCMNFLCPKKLKLSYQYVQTWIWMNNSVRMGHLDHSAWLLPALPGILD